MSDGKNASRKNVSIRIDNGSDQRMWKYRYKRNDYTVRRFVTKRTNGDELIYFNVRLGRNPLPPHNEIRYNRSTLEGAIAAAEEHFDKVSAGLSKQSAFKFTPRIVADYQLSIDILAKAGHPEVTLAECASAYCKTFGSIVQKTLGDAFSEYMSRFNEEQKNHVRTVKKCINPLVESFGASLPMCQIDEHDASKYMEKAYGKYAPTTWNQALGYIKAFFNWATNPGRAYAQKNPFDVVEKKQVSYKEPEFIHADKAEEYFSMLENIDDESRRSEAIVASAMSFFCGVRGEEIFRLRVSDVDMTERTIRISMPKGYTKGIQPRTVPMTDAAYEWMHAYMMPKANLGDRPMFRLFNSSSSLREYTRRHGIKIEEKNCGRHTFATMHAALHGNLPETLSIMGTSRQVCKYHYMGLVGKAEAEKFFAIRPSITQETL